MPTPYPKCTPTELMGFLVLLNNHKGEEDIARLADDLDLEIDEIVPAAEFAEVLGLVRVNDGRAILSDLGRQVLSASIRDRKALLRAQLGRTTLFKAIMRALDRAPGHSLSADQAERLVAFTTTPADEYVQNIINWGRFVELFRYDAETGMITAMSAPATSRTSIPPKSPPRGASPARPPKSRGEEDEEEPLVSPADRAVSSILQVVRGNLAAELTGKRSIAPAEANS